MSITSIEHFEELRVLLEEERASSARRVRVCTGGGCLASGAEEIVCRLRAVLNEIDGVVRVVETGCMGPCAGGPMVAVDPDGSVYAKVSPADAEEIAREHLVGGRPVERLLSKGRPDAGQSKVVLRNCGRIDPKSIEDYIAVGGYSGFVSALQLSDRSQIIERIKQAGIRGRGGAGFPTWRKWQFTAVAEGDEKFVLCNADEGDPGAFMDRSLLEGDPHAIIEGMALAALAVGARVGFVYVRAEYPIAVERLASAIAQAHTSGLLGEGILGTDFAFDLEIRKGSGAFVCGEETALIHSIEGLRGEPTPRPPFPAQSGLWGKPTLLNNVETYANVTAAFHLGPEVYSLVGTEASKGTKVFALAGAVRNTGLVEVAIGTTLGELIYEIGGGIKNDKPFKAAQIGGPSGGCVPKQHLNVPLDYEGLQKVGAIMGSGGLIVMDDDTCMVDVARFFLEFVQEESCGKCTPCRVGTKRMLEILNRICEGHGEEEDIDTLLELGEQIRETALCGLGQTSANPVLSTIRHFREEYEDHIRNKHCEAGVCPALVRAPCQSACPAGVDIPGFVSLVGEKRYAEALRLHRNRNPFAAVCARVCFHTCEEKCRRRTLDDAVAVRAIKRHMVDSEVVVQLPEIREYPGNADRKVAIVGAGPAGLSCAYFLARLGYKPVVFEAETRPGGMLVQAIPAYRLPRETLAREIRMIENLGVSIDTEARLGRDFTLSSLRDDGYEAVFLGLGAPDCTPLEVPGAEGPGVVPAGEFLRQYNVRGSVPVGEKVVVVGGGNAAIDAARTAIRLGAEVTIVYRRTREQMPAYTEEIDEALAEGVELLPLVQPLEVMRAEGDAVTGLRCVGLSLGEFDRSGRRRPTRTDSEPFLLAADQIIVAIGQRLDDNKLFDVDGVLLNDDGFIRADPVTGATSAPGLYAGGDAVLGPASVVDAIAAGERAAYGIDLHLTGADHAFWRQDLPVDTAFDPDAPPSQTGREEIATVPLERRRHSFCEVELPWSEPVAVRQAGRCLRCDYGRQPAKEETHA